MQTQARAARERRSCVCSRGTGPRSPSVHTAGLAPPCPLPAPPACGRPVSRHPPASPPAHACPGTARRARAAWLGTGPGQLSLAPPHPDTSPPWPIRAALSRGEEGPQEWEGLGSYVHPQDTRRASHSPCSPPQHSKPVFGLGLQEPRESRLGRQPVCPGPPCPGPGPHVRGSAPPPHLAASSGHPGRSAVPLFSQHRGSSSPDSSAWACKARGKGLWPRVP